VESTDEDRFTELVAQLRGPVASIESYVRTLVARDADLTPPARSTIHQVLLQHTRRLDHVLDDVVLYLRLLTSSVEASPTSFLVGGLLEEVRQASGEPQRVVVELAEGGMSVRTDRAALTAALRRLVRNALVYGPRLGVVTLVAHADDGVPEIEVRDSGRGIPHAQVDEAVAPFMRAVGDDERRRDGMGLGLTVARALVTEVLGGELLLRDNEPGLSAVVRLS
jgi:signal transduction histidine kinase